MPEDVTGLYGGNEALQRLARETRKKPRRKSIDEGPTVLPEDVEQLIDDCITQEGLDKLLSHVMPDYMRVYVKGLASSKEAIALKCADVLREMKLGRVSQAPPPPDPLKNSLMVVGSLPDVHSGPTVGELAELEAEVNAEVEAEMDTGDEYGE